MTNQKCPHDLRAVLPKVVKDREGNDVEIMGQPPKSEEEPAWCRICGALWSKSPFGGWGFQHHYMDEAAPTLLNILRKHTGNDDSSWEEQWIRANLDGGKERELFDRDEVIKAMRAAGQKEI